MEISAQNYSGFTCVKCHVGFPDGEVQREHFQSDWHRYNLKRIVADLPAVTVEAFKERVLSQRSKEEQDISKTHTYCSYCSKTFKKYNAYLNHIKSKKHLDAEKKSANRPDELPSSSNNVPSNSISNIEEQDNIEERENDSENMEVEEVDSDEWEGEPIPHTDCLFCSHHSASLDKNLKHMTLKHTFFLPELEYCVDIVGLITYLGKKVGSGLECLWCNEKSKCYGSLEAVQQHMIDIGHCQMKLQGEMLLECGEFYDFSTSYPDAGKEVSPDEEIEENVLAGDDFQLVLPSGNVIGHRSLNRYYRQNFDANRELALLKSNQSVRIHSILSDYRALGWKGASLSDIKRKDADLKYMNRMKNKSQLLLSKKANKMQHHYRAQVLF